MKVKLKETYTTGDGTKLVKGRAYDAYAMDNGQYAVKCGDGWRVILGQKYIKEVVGS